MSKPHVTYQRGPSVFEYVALHDGVVGEGPMTVLRVEVQPSWECPGKYAWCIRDEAKQIIHHGERQADVAACIAEAERAFSERAAFLGASSQFDGGVGPVHYAMAHAQDICQVRAAASPPQPPPPIRASSL